MRTRQALAKKREALNLRFKAYKYEGENHQKTHRKNSKENMRKATKKTQKHSNKNTKLQTEKFWYPHNSPPCRPTRLGKQGYVGVFRNRTAKRFATPNVQEDEETGLPKKLTRKEQKGQLQDIPKKLRANNKQATKKKEDPHKKQHREDCNFARRPQRHGKTTVRQWRSLSQNNHCHHARTGRQLRKIQQQLLNDQAWKRRHANYPG